MRNSTTRPPDGSGAPRERLGAAARRGDDSERVLPDGSAVARLVRPAFGLAVGTALGLSLFGLAVFHATLELPHENELFVWLLGRNFLPGYAPTMEGAAAGLVWGLVAGYALGWTAALVRDVLLAIHVQLVVRRERLRADARVLEEMS